MARSVFLQSVWRVWLLVAPEEVILRVEAHATVVFLVWFWEKAMSCDGYGDGLRLIREMSSGMATISPANWKETSKRFVGFF